MAENKSKFQGLFDKEPEGLAEDAPEPAPESTRTTRPTGKRSNPEWRKGSLIYHEKTHMQVTRRLQDLGIRMDISEFTYRMWLEALAMPDEDLKARLSK